MIASHRPSQDQVTSCLVQSPLGTSRISTASLGFSPPVSSLHCPILDHKTLYLTPKKGSNFLRGAPGVLPKSWPDCGGLLSLRCTGWKSGGSAGLPGRPLPLGSPPSFLCSQGFCLLFTLPTELRPGGGRGQGSSPYPATHTHWIPETSQTDTAEEAGPGLRDSGAGLNHRLTGLYFLLIWGGG